MIHMYKHTLYMNIYIYICIVYICVYKVCIYGICIYEHLLSIEDTISSLLSFASVPPLNFPASHHPRSL
jgi:hypothetical protein